jgi:hypothetical protein
MPTVFSNYYCNGTQRLQSGPNSSGRVITTAVVRPPLPFWPCAGDLRSNIQFDIKLIDIYLYLASLVGISTVKPVGPFASKPFLKS